MTKVLRGQSSAAKAAAAYLAKHPDTLAADLARKFKINITTVYRSDWWKNRNQEQRHV